MTKVWMCTALAVLAGTSCAHDAANLREEPGDIVRTALEVALDAAIEEYPDKLGGDEALQSPNTKRLIDEHAATGTKEATGPLTEHPIGFQPETPFTAALSPPDAREAWKAIAQERRTTEGWIGFNENGITVSDPVPHPQAIIVLLGTFEQVGDNAFRIAISLTSPWVWQRYPPGHERYGGRKYLPHGFTYIATYRLLPDGTWEKFGVQWGVAG